MFCFKFRVIWVFVSFFNRCFNWNRSWLSTSRQFKLNRNPEKSIDSSNFDLKENQMKTVEFMWTFLCLLSLDSFFSNGNIDQNILPWTCLWSAGQTLWELNLLKFSISRKSDLNFGRDSATVERRCHGRRDVIKYVHGLNLKCTQLDF